MFTVSTVVTSCYLIYRCCSWISCFLLFSISACVSEILSCMVENELSCPDIFGLLQSLSFQSFLLCQIGYYLSFTHSISSDCFFPNLLVRIAHIILFGVVIFRLYFSIVALAVATVALAFAIVSLYFICACNGHRMHKILHDCLLSV